MLCGIDFVGGKLLALGKRGDLGVLLLVSLLSALLYALLIHCHISGERNGISARAEDIACRFYLDVKGCKGRRLHLTCDESVPDKLIELILICRQIGLYLLGLEGDVGGTDRLVRILDARFGFKGSGLGGVILVAEFFCDIRSGSVLSLGGNTERVGTHIGDKTLNAAVLASDVDTLVKLLSDSHRSLKLEAELSVSLLLKRGGVKGRTGCFMTGRALDRLNGKLTALDRVYDLHCVCLVAKLDLAVLIAEEAHREGYSLARDERDLDGPILNGNEALDLLLALDDDLCRYRLNSSCAESALDVLPKQRRDLISYDSVKDSSCLLGVYKAHIDVAGLFDRRLDHALGDLVEGDSLRLFDRYSECCRKMPRDSLSLTVRVGCEIYFGCVLCFLLDLLDYIAFAADVDIMSLEIIVNINAEGGFGQVTDVSYRCDDLIV